MSKTLRLTLAQCNPLVGDIEGNAAAIIDTYLTHTRDQDCDLLLFPELALTGYPPEDLLFRADCHTRCQAALSKIQAITHSTALVVGHPHQNEHGLYNSASVFQAGQCLTRYDKQCLPNDTVFDEKRYFSPGEKSVVFPYQDRQIGLLICEDIWQDEPMARAVAAGADLIICLNASPFARDKRVTRSNRLQAQARTHACPIAYANLVGGQDELVFDGGSCLVDQAGAITHFASYFKPDLLSAELGNTTITAPSPSPLIDTLSDLDYLYDALVLGLKDYVLKNNFPGVLLGLSGGIDSALCLALAVDALGADCVSAIMMPSCYTSDLSTHAALDQIERLGVASETLAIDSILNAHLAVLSPAFTGYAPDLTEENLQARIRGTLLMALSNKKGGLLIATGNKSELAVGYSTLYGDLCGGFAPLKDIEKTMVFTLATHRNTRSLVIPKVVISRPPSAELRANQVDEDSLPPYPILDQIIDLYINQEQSIEAIIGHGIAPELVRHIVQLIHRNEYKRRQAPPGTRTSWRAFGKDRRYPITSGYARFEQPK
jgi:NAD+ synthase (glutamine-hydrolysing)